MTTRRAMFTQVEIERVLRAAKEVGFGRVELIPSAAGPPRIVCEVQAKGGDGDELEKKVESLV